MLTILKDLFRRPARRLEFDINDPRHPVNAGWRRVDLPEGRRRVRFIVSVPDIPKVAPLGAAPPRPELTNREFTGRLRSDVGDDFTVTITFCDSGESATKTEKPLPLQLAASLSVPVYFAAILYVRSPLAFLVESTASPILLATVPEMKPLML
jgi:hypothetical protein